MTCRRHNALARNKNGETVSPDDLSGVIPLNTFAQIAAPIVVAVGVTAAAAGIRAALRAAHCAGTSALR